MCFDANGWVDGIECIKKLSQSMERYETEAFSNSPLSNLTPTQVHYLDAIFHLKDPKVSELASYLNVSKPTVTFALNKMEAGLRKQNSI